MSNTWWYVENDPLVVGNRKTQKVFMCVWKTPRRVGGVELSFPFPFVFFFFLLLVVMKYDGGISVSVIAIVH